MDKEERHNHDRIVWYVFMTLVALFAMQWVVSALNDTQSIPYSQFQKWVDQGKIKSVTVSANAIKGELKEPDENERRFFETARVDQQIADKLIAKDVVVNAAPAGGWLVTLFSWIAPLFLLYFFWSWMFKGIADRQGMGGMLTIGRSRARIYVEKDIRVTFADVEGAPEAKRELQEVVSFLKDPDTFGRRARARAKRHIAGGAARDRQDAIGARRGR